MTEASKEIDPVVALSLETPALDNSILSFKYILFIYYPMRFKKNQDEIKALLNFGNEVNVMTPDYTARLGFKVQPTNVSAQKIDSSTLKIFGIVLTSF